MLNKLKIPFALILTFVMLVMGADIKGADDENITVEFSIEDITSSPEIKFDKCLEEAKIKVNFQGEIREMAMEDYLISVVAGEVYPSYEMDALKAQAIAARTYLVYKMEKGGCANGGDICTESAHCQAYKTEEKMRSGWGDKYDEYYDKIKTAVYETKGEIVLYDNKPINALYHSSSVDKTEDCVAVFGGTYPYLKSVSSTVSTNNSEYEKEITFSKKEFLEKVKASFNIDVDEIQLKIISYTASGRVSTLKIGEKSVKATALRKCLGLRSTDFIFEISDDKITFIMKGFGHGVGLSQVGAQEMALQGKNYKEILTHYYTGTEIGVFTLQ